ncbi:MAG: hypothetical protein WAS07_11125 [Micropruina sp.]
MSMRIALSALSAALLVLAGCTPTVPVSSPTPAPTFQCTPEAGGAEAACSQAEFERQQKMDALYAEAELVYRKYVAEDVRVARTGGADRLSEAYTDTIGDEALLDQILEINRELKQRRAEVRGGKVLIAWVHRKPGVSIEGSLLALEACVDASASKNFQAGEYVRDGVLFKESSYFKMYESKLKISSLSYRMVKSCA